MSKANGNKRKNTELRQTVMGDFYSKADKTKKVNKTESPKKGQAGQKKSEQGTSKEPKRTSLKRKVTGAGMFTFSWTRGSQRDTEEYRNGYPGKEDNADLQDNYLFYMNKIPSKPDGDFIDKIHMDWWGDYRRLEIHHGYIQWLFPIRDTGLNWQAQELQLHEIKRLQKNKKAMKRILTSYKMMLDFYGMKLENEEDGTIVRAENWQSRFRHLNSSYHNYLRITRILKCLGEFGYEHLKKNFVKFVLMEGMVEGTLDHLIDSCVKYWIGVLKEDDEREEMFDLYEKLLREETTSKRRNRSPSPPLSYHFDNNSDDKVKNETKQKAKAVNSGTRSGGKKDSKDESSDEDSTLYYAMSLIDEDKDEDEKEKVTETKKDGVKSRKDHEISDEEDDQEEQSQEMAHWNAESKVTNEEDLAAGSESLESFVDDNFENEAIEKAKNRTEETVLPSKEEGNEEKSENTEAEKEKDEITVDDAAEVEENPEQQNGRDEMNVDEKRDADEQNEKVKPEIENEKVEAVVTTNANKSSKSIAEIEGGSTTECEVMETGGNDPDTDESSKKNNDETKEVLDETSPTNNQDSKTGEDSDLKSDGTEAMET